MKLKNILKNQLHNGGNQFYINMLDVSCIIINYNTSNYTFEAVRSLYETHKNNLNFEIIVVDNASKKDDYTNLKSKLDSLHKNNLQLIRSTINTGFGGGNMLGVSNASPTKYYAFINNDTLQVSEYCLKYLMEFLEAQPQAGLCSPQMLDEHQNFRVTIDHFSSLQREILRRPFLETFFPKIYLNRKIRYKAPTKVHYVQGSFMFIGSADFNEIGGFDTNLFLYYEESDISLRLLKLKNKYTYLVPSLEYIHYKSVSTKKNIDIKIEQKISLLYYTKKHYGWGQQKILNLYFIIRYFFTALVKPKYWKLFMTLLIGAPLSKSLKAKQKKILL